MQVHLKCTYICGEMLCLFTVYVKCLACVVTRSCTLNLVIKKVYFYAWKLKRISFIKNRRGAPDNWLVYLSQNIDIIELNCQQLQLTIVQEPIWFCSQNISFSFWIRKLRKPYIILRSKLSIFVAESKNYFCSRHCLSYAKLHHLLILRKGSA